jgi:uncharacterized membrane protein
MTIIRSAVLAIAAQVALSSATLADISICNDFRARIRAALAQEEAGAFRAAGWWAVDPNACRDIDFPFQGAVLYYTADSDTYREGNKTLRDHWGNKQELFVGNKDFKFTNAEKRQPNAKPAKFSLVSVSEKLQAKPVVIVIRFTSGSTTVTVKAK